MVPQEYLVPYLISNAVALGVLALAFRWPRIVKWIWVAIFIWAATVNTLTAVREPWVYLAYGALTPSDLYRRFIEGWFSEHVAQLVLPIAAGQLTIAVLLTQALRARRVGVFGAVVFLLAIAPLGVGSAFPFSLTAAASLLVMERRLRESGRVASPASTFIPDPDARDEHEIEIHAPAALVFDAATHADLLANPIVAALIRTRACLMRDTPKPRAATGLVAETLALGWGVLAYTAGRTLVMGAVARPWARDVTFSAVEPSEFARFAEPDLVKIVWTLEAEPLGEERTRFRTETRVQATDPDARRRFLWYWLMVGAGIRLIRWATLRALQREAERRYRGESVHRLRQAA
jgi:hypothetical protein